MTEFNRAFNKRRRRRRVKGKGLTKKQRLQVKKMVEEPLELKYYDYPFQQAAISLTPAFNDMLEPAQGTNSNSRIGSSICLKNISYRLEFEKADATNYVRMVIFQWYIDTQTSNPTWPDLFEFHTGSNPINMSELVSPLVLGEGVNHTFKVIKTVDFILDSDSPRTLIRGMINKGFKKNIYYQDGSQDGNNHIFVMFVSDSGTIAHPTVSGYFRFRYCDG